MTAQVKVLIQTEAGCRQLLKEVRFANEAFDCARCRHTEAYEIKSRPGIIECANCGKQTSLTAGTFLHGKKLPLTKCFAILFAFLNNKPKSTSQLAEELDLWESTVWRWGQQIRLLLNDLFIDIEDCAVDIGVIRRVLFRRSVETPAVNSEQPQIESVASGEEYSDEERLSILKTQRFVSRYHHGVSKKYAQLYAAEYRFFLRSKQQSIKTLLGFVLGAGPVSVEDVHSYSSPQFIILPIGPPA